ncbi:hypothetical protein DTO166G4_8111 [Paecilomyces variotii]|nr:hypothetical protein DTO166G4_8111 [Paecilomyces variotii]KAJ9241594.1 hypothetical protein DTO166G5_1215 [Paecilomyces variotii]KAJ9400809.1 hypothetical protein DTO282F9_2377 [Paecilomyces variotii]
MASHMLHNKCALITGAAQGIGRATAELFARAGAKVVIADINDIEGQTTVSALQEIAKDIESAEAYFVHTDISKSAEVQRAVQQTVQKFGKLDVAINNAAITPDRTSLFEFDEDYWRRVVDINLTGTALCCKYEMQQMIKQKTNNASIINIASINAFRPQPKMPAYTATKHALVGLTKHAAMEGAHHGIRVNLVAPGAIHTQMSAESLKIVGATHQQIASVVSLLGRFGETQEVAQGLLWLASDAASYVTGVCLPIDGGFLAR